MNDQLHLPAMHSIPDLNIPSARPLLIAFTLLIFSSCATSNFSPNTPTRMASDVPDHFLVCTHANNSTCEPKPNEGCRSPMIDPLDGTRLELIRSNGEYGDYKVPDNRYGVEMKELLRLECSTGRIVGIVQR